MANSIASPSQALDMELENELKAGAESGERMFAVYNNGAHLAFWLGIAASSAATVMAATGSVKGYVLAIVTAMGPALIATRAYLTRGANWHKNRELALRNFRRELKFENATVEDVSRRFRAFEEAHEKSWQSGTTARGQDKT